MKKTYLKPNTEVTGMQPVRLLDASVRDQNGNTIGGVGNGGTGSGWGNSRGQVITGGHISGQNSAWD